VGILDTGAPKYLKSERRSHYDFEALELLHQTDQNLAPGQGSGLKSERVRVVCSTLILSSAPRRFNVELPSGGDIEAAK
jgi:hypothetical protein